MKMDYQSPIYTHCTMTLLKNVMSALKIAIEMDAAFSKKENLTAKKYTLHKYFMTATLNNLLYT